MAKLVGINDLIINQYVHRSVCPGRGRHYSAKHFRHHQRRIYLGNLTG